MGISTHFYTICGIKAEWNEEFACAHDEVYDNPDTPFVLFDGIGGKYTIFGEVLFDSGDARWGFEDGDHFKEIDLSMLSEIEANYKKKFAEKFPQFKHLVEQPFKVMTLSHHS
jgi:hypothetical protein